MDFCKLRLNRTDHEVHADNVTSSGFTSKTADACSNVRQRNCPAVVGIKNIGQPGSVLWIDIQLVKDFFCLRILYGLIDHTTSHLDLKKFVHCLREVAVQATMLRVLQDARDQSGHPGGKQVLIGVTPLLFLLGHLLSCCHRALNKDCRDHIEEPNSDGEGEQAKYHTVKRPSLLLHPLEDRRSSNCRAVAETASESREH
mmetsp:Transcript_65245/g.144980  ORF Transcript_65245/g.144980 Transcript_65245/m.144980 type:complete len:200 (+) Transcript_65245:109-708(+)